ncbi:MAG: M23 family metallopeptidase [Actinobacteria bacterium]|nr:M23 family metallopeptidase [Actinomycetota bacterium]
MAGLFGLALVRPRWDREQAPVAVRPPVRGRWVAMNSPATKVPSHGLRAYGQTYAIDILHPRPPGARRRPSWGLGLRSPEDFTSFGEPVRAVADGVVVSTASRQRDHLSRLSWFSIVYLLLVEGFCRELGGARFVLGNHVVVDHGDGLHSAYAHLRRGSLTVATGDRVDAGTQLGEVGNSGNTTEPHLHVQLMDDASVTGAAGLPFRWEGIEVADDLDPTITDEPVDHDVPGVPADGQVFFAWA